MCKRLFKPAKLTSLLLLGIITGNALADTLLIENATLLDMVNDRPQRNVNILIQGDTIREVWSGNRGPEIPDDVVIIDAKGKYVMPGLMDSHVHYNWYMGELFLHHGITTVVDLGSRIYWQKALQKGLNSGKLRGPKYLFCGRIGTNEQSNYAAVAQRRLFATASSPREARRAVSAIKDNSDCLRMGMDTEDNLYQAINLEANRAGLGVISHSYDAIHSAELGVNGIEHLEGIALATIRSEEGRAAVATMQLEEGRKHPLLYQWMEERYYDEVIDILVENNIYLNPTFIHEWKGVIDRTDEFEQDDLTLFTNPELQYIPMDEKLVSLNQYHWADQAYADNPSGDQLYVNNSYFISAEGLKESLETGYKKIQEFLDEFVDAGGKIYSGTDTAAASTPGISLHHEMQLLVDAGISELNVLKSSTIWPAELLRIDDRHGTIEPGKVGDVLILEANPLADIGNARKIYSLIMNGKVIDRNFYADYDNPFPQYGTVSKHQYHQQPVINNVEPPIVTELTTSTITIIGDEFQPETVVLFNGEKLQTRYINHQEIQAILTRQYTRTPGSHLIGAATPAPGGGEAVPMEFIVDYR